MAVPVTPRAVAPPLEAGAAVATVAVPDAGWLPPAEVAPAAPAAGTPDPLAPSVGAAAPRSPCVDDSVLEPVSSCWAAAPPAPPVPDETTWLSSPAARFIPTAPT